MAESEHITWGQRIRTWLVVTLITLLVWLYAEGQATSTSPEQQFTVRFVAPGQNVAIEPNDPVRVEAVFRGSTGQLAQVNNLIEEGSIELEVAAPADGSDEQNIVMKEALLNSELGDLGVNITEISPTTQTVRIQPRVTVSLPVKLADQDLQVASPPRFEPATVEVTLPAQRASAAEGQAVLARLDETQRASLEPNAPRTLRNVTLDIPAALQSPWTAVEPGTVNATIEIRSSTYTKPRISVDIMASPLLFRDYTLDIPDEHLILQNVELTGPAETLEQIENDELSVTAWVRPTFDQLDSQVTDEPTIVELPVHFDLPPNVDPPSPQPLVPVTVTRKE